MEKDQLAIRKPDGELIGLDVGGEDQEQIKGIGPLVQYDGDDPLEVPYVIDNKNDGTDENDLWVVDVNDDTTSKTKLVEGVHGPASNGKGLLTVGGDCSNRLHDGGESGRGHRRSSYGGRAEFVHPGAESPPGDHRRLQQ
ncbi:MAG: hypothetical protein ABEK29_08730 [Bradymonadaceae bacterium]